MIIRVLLTAVAWMAASSQTLSPSPSPSPGASPSESCSEIILDMTECLAFLDIGSKETKPTSGCCTGFESVVKTNVNCICDSVMSSTNLGLKLNRTRALALPSICGISISTDGFSGCGLDQSPPSESPAPAPAPEVTSSTSPSPSPPPPSKSPKAPAARHAQTPGPSPSLSPSPSPSPSPQLHKGASSKAAAASPTVVAISMLVAVVVAA